MVPTFILIIWLTGLFSLGILGGAIYFGHEWYQRSWSYDAVSAQSIFVPDFTSQPTATYFYLAVGLALFALLGGQLIKLILRLFKTKEPSDDPRKNLPAPGSEHRILRPDGSEIIVETYGNEEAPPIVLTHGWGMHSHEWDYLKRELSDEYRLIVWDEPGLGRSQKPLNGDYSLEKLAQDLDAVLTFAENKPAVLLGHSIGGMITLTFCKLFPEALGSRVSGLILANTTPTNPVRTVLGAGFFTAIETPVLKPLMFLTIGLSPLVWLMNLLSYLNGSAHLMTMLTSYGGSESWQQIEFATRFQPQAPPAVLARGMLGMMHYNATDILAAIPIPALVVVGDRDPVTKPEAGRKIQATIPDATLLTLEPGKHLALIEHHAQFAQAVRKLMAQTDLVVAS